MATKYQDSTPQRKIWEVGKASKPLAWNTWGYDSVLVAIKADDSIKLGSVMFEGYIGFHDEDTTEWGDWYPIYATDVLSDEKYEYYDLSKGSAAMLSKIIGFSQFRVSLLDDLVGEGKVQVTLACHAV